MSAPYGEWGMKRPDDFILQLDPILKDYITFLEGNFLRVIRAIFPNVKEFDPAHVAPAVLFIEQEQGAAPESTTPWYKNWLTWVVIAILLGFATCSYFLGDQG